MFGIGSTELLVILVVALIVLGPKSLPQMARTLGKALGEFRRVSTDFQRTLNAEVDLEDHQRRKKEAEKEFFSEEAKAEKPAAKSSAEAAPKSDTADGAKPDVVIDAQATRTETKTAAGKDAA
ncbi:Sec-independent protein translocase protein TatB [Nitratidesulfovibrio vulgaris]|jgi:sec-independent protein translocase protein TatB|uniref:Sec-independent protein translocase protein TatB homolog n=2 Tax=Nitratidesulfovibrio vulgaris TaxID=881 RepID=Q72D87_NITV2|nr:Sec-independent protein translocase protein TatB [Nitratidesulfovibrio vulgaris]GEB81432.1 Sec-independent protein translocase protein TatB [Desulfovibrio desulfuricans]HBW16491.1 twin-arginine translocase subunit TatB [Desulfovibrio sp.]AAS95522.1 twin-arginine translocation protein TatB [Nitratidesulfovibrio vulgaris str. Hildenborough]ABM28967.1 twin-arginine translocation protein, TatB subunit [Nitratidesulfovibrio vulgaris DP4]ADP86125.1 twin-arginine translocation protein, TatB subuni